MEDHEERGLQRRNDVLALVLKAADAGEVLSIPEMQRRLPWGVDITKHGLIHIVSTLENQGYVVRRWGPELSPTMKSGRKSFVLPCAKAYAKRAGS